MAGQIVKRINRAFFEDSRGYQTFFYNSKDTVLGLRHPDNTISNIDDNSAIKLGHIVHLSLDELYINEEFKLELYMKYANTSIPTVLNVRLIGSMVDGAPSSDFIFEYEIISRPSDILTEDEFNDTISRRIVVILPKIYMIKGTTIMDDMELTTTELWIDATSIQHMYSSIIKTVAMNYAPIDRYHLTSGYHLNLFDTVTLLEEDVSQDLSAIEANATLTVSLHKIPSSGISSEEFASFSTQMAEQIANIQRHLYHSTHEMKINQDFVPDEIYDTYQNIPITEIDSSILSLDADNGYVYIDSDATGIYSVQLLLQVQSDFYETLADATSSKIELAVAIESIIDGSLFEYVTMVEYDPKISLNPVSSPMSTCILSADYKLSLKIKITNNSGQTSTSVLGTNGNTFIKAVDLHITHVDEILK